MKESEVELSDTGSDEGFEEVNAPRTEGSTGGNRPDFRVVQADRDKEGNPVYINVGGMWKNVSKAGNEFYTLKIGQLKLLVFRNNR